MMTNSKKYKDSAEKTVRDTRRRTRRHYSAEDKIRIVLEGLRGEDSIAELCRREGINSNVYYRWSKEFLEAGKKRLAGDTVREATTDEVKNLRSSIGNNLILKPLKSGSFYWRVDSIRVWLTLILQETPDFDLHRPSTCVIPK
jgi:transposase